MLLKRDWSETLIKVEQASHAIDTEEVCDVDIVRQCGTQPDNTDQRLRAFDLSIRSSDKGLEDSSSGIVQHVHFIDDQQADLLNKLSISGGLAGDNIPLFWRSDNDLSGHDL